MFLFLFFFSFHLVIGGPISLDGIIPLFFALDLSISLDGIIPLFFALDLSISLDGIKKTVFFLWFSCWMSIFLNFLLLCCYFPRVLSFVFSCL